MQDDGAPLSHVDVIIAGGGVIGLTTALALMRAGLSVTVVDAGAPTATAAAAGMLAPTFESALHARADLEAFARESLARWRVLAPDLEEQTGVAVDLQTAGILSVLFGDEGASDFPDDLKGGEALTAAQARALEPSLASDVEAAWFARGDGQIDPRALLRALDRALAIGGARIVRGERVAGIEQSTGGVCGVILSTGQRLAAGSVILATGAQIDGIGLSLASCVFPVKGEALALTRGAGAPALVVRTRSAYLCPKADGRIIVGATEIAGDRTLDADDARIAALKKGAVRAAPLLAGAAEVERWAGLRPATPDSLPIIGPAPAGPRGLYYALGHYRNGVLLAPATAAALARLIISGDPAPDAFSATRFGAPVQAAEE